MRVLVLGGLGSIGRRYTTILRFLGHEPIVWDTASKKEDLLPLRQYGADKAIIATPTNCHFEQAKELLRLNIPFLCEKPVSKDLSECEFLAEKDTQRIGRVVNNYAWLRMMADGPSVYYNYYNTGQDGLLWDVCQLIYIDPEAQIHTDCPVWTLKMGTRHFSYRELEQAYIHMIESFISHGTGLWDLVQGAQMTYAVLERQKCG